MLLLVLGGREWSCLEELYYIMLSLLAPTSCSAIVMGAIVDGVSSFCFVPASRIPLFLLKSLTYIKVHVYGPIGYRTELHNCAGTEGEVILIGLLEFRCLTGFRVASLDPKKIRMNSSRPRAVSVSHVKHD